MRFWSAKTLPPKTPDMGPGYGAQASSRIVTGPSATSSMAMSAPNDPVATSSPWACAAPRRPASTSGSATGPGAAADQLGRRPLRVSAYRVNWLTTSTGAPDVEDRPLVAQDPQPGDLAGERVGLGGAVVVRHADQDDQAGPVDRPDDLPVDGDGSAGDPLDDGAHRASAQRPGSAYGAEVDRLDPADRLAVAEDDRLVEQLVEDRRVAPERRERCGQDRRPGPFRAVGDLERDRPAVWQRDCVDALGAVLGDQPGHAGISRVTSRPVPPTYSGIVPIRLCHKAFRRVGSAVASRANARARPLRLTARTGAPQPSTPVGVDRLARELGRGLGEGSCSGWPGSR